MTQDEMRRKFDDLYNLMASGSEVEHMRVFGKVEREMMDWMIHNKPEMAQEWIEKLCSIRWRNYLTTKEAEKVVSLMVPKAPWSREAWRQAMASAGLAVEEEPDYNACALWAVMSMIYSDSSETISKLLGVGADDAQALAAIHMLALDKLKDQDGRFDVRRYFAL